MKLRTLATSVLCLCAAACMRSWGGNEPWELWLPTGLLVLAAGLVHQRSTGSQLLARAVLWSNLILAVVAAWVGNQREIPVAALLGGSTGLALLALGRAGLDRADGGFVPVAFRSTLVALMVMALADAQTLLLFGSLLVGESFHSRTGYGALAIALGLTVAVVGLYRLRVWGVLAQGLGAAALIAFIVRAGANLPHALDIALLASAVLQLVLVGPLVVALAVGARPAPEAPRRSVIVGALAVAALTIAALAPLAIRIY